VIFCSLACIFDSTVVGGGNGAVGRGNARRDDTAWGETALLSCLPVRCFCFCFCSFRMRTNHCPWRRPLHASTSSRNDRVRFRAMAAGSEPRRSAGSQPAFLGTDLGLGSSSPSLCPRRERQTLNRLASVVVQSDQGADMGGWEEASVRRVARTTRHLKSRGFKLLEKRKRKYDGLRFEQSLIGFH
jgi:hypothetical protein